MTLPLLTLPFGVVARLLLGVCATLPLALPLALPLGDPVRLVLEGDLDALLTPLFPLLALTAEPADFLEAALSALLLCFALAGLDPGIDCLSGVLAPEVS